jgi:membrane-associated phospholipid phosphatase
LIVGALLLVDMIGMRRTGFSVRTGDVMSVCKGVAILAGAVVILRTLCAVPRYAAVTAKLRYARIADIAAWCALILSFVPAMCVLSYLCVTVDAPLIETHLIRFDRSIGFDWLATYQWVERHPHIQRILTLAYMSGRMQLLCVPFILGLFAKREALPEFFFLLALASIVLMVVSTPFPAQSAFVAFNISDPGTASTVSDFAALRSGTLRTVDLMHPQGLVSMPSFHTALAVLFAYSLRHVRWLFGCAVMLDLTMILSTPTVGGHYLADVVGGLLLAALTIYLVRTYYRRRNANRLTTPAVNAPREQPQPLNSATP